MNSIQNDNKISMDKSHAYGTHLNQQGNHPSHYGPPVQENGLLKRNIYNRPAWMRYSSARANKESNLESIKDE